MPTPPGQLADQVLHFARLLRSAGLPLGTDRVPLALQALQLAGLASRSEFRSVLAACLVSRAEHRELFDRAFELYWQAPGAAGPAATLPSAGAPPPEPGTAASAALRDGGQAPAVTAASGQGEAGAHLAWSAREQLRRTDFDRMTADEWRQARRLLAQLRPVFEPLPTRRSRRAAHPGSADWRATLNAMARHGGELWDMRWRRPRMRPAPLVLLADISGSMRRYARMLLHLGHALGRADARVESFVFGTRLTRTTRLLRRRDPDQAVSEAVRAVPDWSGGTRITASLHDFNRRWGRRVLAGNTTLLLVTDGLEHGDTDALRQEMQRLQRSCRRLIWLNPLLRFDAFEPRAAGIRAMLPHVDHFLPAHDLRSLEQLVQLLAGEPALSSRA